ncbi:MAG: hypothetical protein JWM80_5044 [Cyanobacteria bacterium RYN_339]|nr:hypothetical protein [Cyanobacteria bacterium RYN_339]
MATAFPGMWPLTKALQAKEPSQLIATPSFAAAAGITLTFAAAATTTLLFIHVAALAGVLLASRYDSRLLAEDARAPGARRQRDKQPVFEPNPRNSLIRTFSMASATRRVSRETWRIGFKPR